MEEARQLTGDRIDAFRLAETLGESRDPLEVIPEAVCLIVTSSIRCLVAAHGFTKSDCDFMEKVWANHMDTAFSIRAGL
jgi:hypothetical protein